jgi:hypothetical protein
MFPFERKLVQRTNNTTRWVGIGRRVRLKKYQCVRTLIASNYLQDMHHKSILRRREWIFVARATCSSVFKKKSKMVL